VPNAAYSTFRRIIWFTSIAIAAVLVPVGCIVAFRNGFAMAFQSGFVLIAVEAIGFSLFIPFFGLEVYPALDRLPHHLAAKDSGLLLVNRYLLRDHHQFLPWADIVGIKSLGKPTARGTKYGVSYHPSTHPKRTDTFELSGDALDQLRPKIPSHIQIA